MRKLAYSALRLWVRIGLFCYYKKIKVFGIENIPPEKPTLFLSNHQNALMDVLLIVTQSNRKSWFLARSDLFASHFWKLFFHFLQMMPIYRLRDGRNQLSKNQDIFDACAALLQRNDSIVLFPEANHCLRRSVRPLSKGFTRIVSNALEKYPNLDIQLVPIGQNYAFPTQTGDSTALHFGKPIAVNDYLDADSFAEKLRSKVFDGISTLTTHIPEEDYAEVIDHLGEEGPVFLNPENVNAMIGKKAFEKNTKGWKNTLGKFFKGIFTLWNLPTVLFWRLFIKPRVPEAEFMATFRFGFVFLSYSFLCPISLLAIWQLYDIKTACLWVLGHAVVNILLVKMGITSSYQRK